VKPSPLMGTHFSRSNSLTMSARKAVLLKDLIVVTSCRNISHQYLKNLSDNLPFSCVPTRKCLTRRAYVRRKNSWTQNFNWKTWNFVPKGKSSTRVCHSTPQFWNFRIFDKLMKGGKARSNCHNPPYFDFKYSKK
jgi:hypothetical protein